MLRFFLIFLLFGLSAISFLDRTNISIAAPELRAGFHLSNVELGWVFSAFLVGYAGFQLVAGKLADRYGPRKMLTAGVLGWCLFTAMTAVVQPHWRFALLLLLGVRFALGVGESIIYPAGNLFVSRWIPTSEQGLANGLIFAGVGAGAGLTPPLLNWVIQSYGWRACFWLSALIGVFAAGVWYLSSRDQPEAHPWISAKELEHIRRGLEAKSTADVRKADPSSASPYRNGQIWLLSASYFSFGYTAWIFFSWFFLYLAEVRHLSLRNSAFFTTLPFLAMTISSPVAGYISDRISHAYGSYRGRSIFAAVSLMLTALLLLEGSRITSVTAAALVLASGAGMLYASQSCYWCAAIAASGTKKGAAAGLMNMGGQIGGALTATLTPWIATKFGWIAAFAVAAIVAFAGGVAWLFVRPTRSSQVSL
ncbi:MFS transporter [Acidipila rosea]|uniref:ACS family glucarate transporter-like MFS transporter n=1 Tax=Acidipila rosea TaxID=768535 RepID=A0A4R1L3T7_9BACT|nr:MFS transporter [Acidipila rosea]TCK72715.1 ACS family glucarate transporter-like MFS transporter [Acidipila rosea]